MLIANFVYKHLMQNLTGNEAMILIWFLRIDNGYNLPEANVLL